MSDKPITLEIPEALLQLAEASHLDLRQIMIDALAHQVNYRQPQHSEDGILPSLAEVEAAIRASENRVASGQVTLRTVGYLEGKVTIADDFDDELPDSFWLGDDA